MDEIQIYYIIASNVSNSLKRQNYEIDPIVREGYKTYQQITEEIKSTKNFCRDEESITLKHLVGTISSNITLYAILDDKLVGVLTFMFNVNREGEKIIVFDGICSPTEFSGRGIGKELIDTLIRIARFNNIKYIKLECKGRVMNYYKKIGFTVTSTNMTYDSDEDSDDEGEPYYYMTLDVSSVTGGKIKNIKNIIRKNRTKKNKKLKKNKNKRKQTKKYHK